ncbi:uncharacterized protein F54H12.2-like [Mercenaria mercenaria]|uniref:uncharacterized protein F54H12.2-like n=1 Tax=Mercenaria mercenaria TaxID=6596 RepID=UPI00234EBE70|nr:uncharacterized protein F54H12.2-like [Mercenaria mercenaria]
MEDHTHAEEISIFNTFPTDTSLQSREWIEYLPANSVNSGSLEFNIPAQTSMYMDLKRSLLHLKIRLVDSSGVPIKEDVNASTINMPFHTMFRQIDVSFQQTPLTKPEEYYAYKSYIDTILRGNVKDRTILSNSQMFFKETGNMDETDANGDNLGLFLRHQRLKGGKIVDMEGPLLLDIFQQQRLIVNGVALTLKLWPNYDAFRIMSEDASVKLQIVDASFKLCVQRLNPAIIVAHEKLFSDRHALYPYQRSVIKTLSVPQGNYNVTADDVFQGLVPNRLVLGLVKSSAFSGDHKKNPLNFLPFDCNFVALYVDGQSIPSKPLQPNYDQKNYVSCYRTLGTFGEDLDIDLNDYTKGYCLYVIDVNPYVTFDVKRRGHCRLDLKFAKAVPESLNLIIYASFPEVMYIDKTRSVNLQ